MIITSAKNIIQDDKFSTIIEYNVFDDEELYKTIRNLQSSHFINLRILCTKNCDESLRDFFSILLERSHKIEVINIEGCESRFSNLFDTMKLYENRDEDVDCDFLTELKELRLTKTYWISHIWSNDKPRIIDLRNLQILHIKHCRSLEYVFSWYPAEMLHQLKELIIEECEALSTIFKRLDDTPNTKFPLLSKVKFKSLPNLRQIYGGHLEFPSLKYLMIEECPILTKLTTGFADPHETLTTDGNSFFELDEIVFDSYDNLVCVISSETLQEFKNLKKLFVSHCEKLKLLFNIHKEVPSSTQILEQLYALTLIDLPKLSCIVNKEISRFYENLKILKVKQCKSLNMLQVPQKLTNLEISDCEVLDKIIIIEEEKGRKEKLTFHELKDVSLENLSKLSVVFPSTSEFPSLQTLKIANCSAMRSFVEHSKALKYSSATTYFFPSSVSLNYKPFIKCVLHKNNMFSFSCHLLYVTIIYFNYLLY